MPQKTAFSGVPSVDFSPLGDLVNVYQQGRIGKARRSLSDLAGGNLDYGAAAKSLLAGGDFEGALMLTRLAESQSNSARAQSNADRDFAFRQQAHQDDMSRPQIIGGPDTGYYAIDRSGNPVGDQQASQPSPASPVSAGAQPQPAQPAGIQPIIPPRAKQLSEVEKALPGEMAARVAVGDKFLDEYPLLRSQVAKGAVTGTNAPWTYFNSGTQGELARKIKSGSEALLRNLTGAGMNIDEAKKYVSRYEPQPLDKAETVLSKIDQLQDELRRFEDEAYRGRGGVPKAKLENRAAIKSVSDAIDNKNVPREQAMKYLRGRGVTFMEGGNNDKSSVPANQIPAQPAPQQSGSSSAAPFNFSKQQIIDEARDAISRGAPRDAVAKRMMEKHGINPSELD